MTNVKDTVHKWVELFNRHDASSMAELYGPDAVNMQVPMNQPVQGKDGMLRAFRRLFQAFPDVHTEIQTIFADGEWVILEWTLRGTFRGEFAGQSGEGQNFFVRGSEFFRIADGTIHEQRGYWDKASWFRQLSLPF